MHGQGVPDLELITLTGGETGAMMRSIDWAATPLGSPHTWPQSLRSTLSIFLNSRFPIAVYWGPEFVLLYNDAWVPMLGDKHPRALGSAGKQVWSEIWDTIGSRFERVMKGEAISGENEYFALMRHGSLQECYFNYTISPVRGEEGRVVGIFNPAVETTYLVLSGRRSQVLQSLAERTAAVESAEDICAVAAGVLALDSADVSFCLMYLVDHDRRRALRAGVAGLAATSRACPPIIDLTEINATCPWPLSSVLETQQLQLVENLQSKVAEPLPGGCWPEPARSGVVVPIPKTPSDLVPAGFLVVGVSPRRPFDEQYAAFVNVAARTLGSAIAHADIRDRKHLELQARLANIASAAPMALFELRRDRDGNLSLPYSTPAIEAIYGMTPEELSLDTEGAITRVNPDDKAAIRALIEESQRTRRGFRTEWRVQHPTKGQLWVAGRATAPELHADGTLVWYGYQQDITERRLMEQKLRESEARSRQVAEDIRRFNEALEEEVAVRTRALAEANRELESFSYTVSHDLRAPLRGVNAFSHLLLENTRERLPPEDRNLLERIADAGRKMNRLIDDILAYSSAGQREMVRRPVTIGALCGEIIAELQPQFPRCRVTLAALPRIDGDETMLRQIFQNLIGNALKFSGSQALPVVEIGSRQSDSQAVYFVRDNGVGFEMRHAEKLFGMFRRLHSDSEFPGTGVGLAIVKRLVERHGGRVWVDSAPGAGTTFFFTLQSETHPPAGT
jgi:signal transduction histidine kinase